ncbi:MAG: site-specific integrase, partial [Planctomycetes bacterium]|nr:site-specific integrase [Planctomycetota bacterium]
TTITLDCRVSKRRKNDITYLPDELGPIFTEYLRDRPREERIWPSRWWDRASAIVRADLRAAGVERGTEAGIIDFHALGRTSYITALVLNGQSWGVVQRLARLSNPALLQRYFGPDEAELRKAVQGLPFCPRQPR